MALDLTFSSPISDTLALVSFEGREALSSPYSFELQLSCADATLDLNAALTQAVTITASLPSGDSQIWHGLVTSFAQGAQTETGSVTYYARVEPWFALLRLNVDYQVFQNQTVPAILAAVFQKLGLSDFKNALTGTYTAREYCVQFGESTFDFLSRLMESEGIFYFFTHTASAHTLVLVDDLSACPALPGIPTIRFNQTGRTTETVDLMTGGGLEQQLAPNRIASTDYNFVTPATDLYSTSEGSAAGSFASVLSVYRYPGLFLQKADGETATSLQLTSAESGQLQLNGSSQCRAFQAGAKFTLADHFNSAANVAYILRSVTHHLSEGGARYANEFTAFPASITWRPPQLTRGPQVAGAQTATVVGKAGEQLWTDQYGRIKIKFPWDRSTATDDTCSCWVRVAQPWAGQGFGGLFLPRIGQEVVVTFLDGNPDRPLVTGSVYNGTQTVPYTLPDSQTKSTIKTSNLTDATKYNELRFDDTADAEELLLRAQKDLTVTALGDQNVTIANNRTVTVTSKDDKHTVSAGNRTLEVTKGDETYTVGGKRDLTVTGDETHTNKADFTQKVTGDYTLKVTGDLLIDVTGSVTIKSGGAFLNKSALTLENQAGTSLTNQAGTSLTNSAGTTMSNEAQISIASKANAQHTVESSGILTLKGSLVQIN